MAKERRRLSRREQLAQRPKVHTFIPQESEVQQSMKDQCDLNKVIGRYDKVMTLDFLASHHDAQGGQYGDFTDVPDYRTALDIKRSAEAAFMTDRS